MIYINIYIYIIFYIFIIFIKVYIGINCHRNIAPEVNTRVKKVMRKINRIMK